MKPPAAAKPIVAEGLSKHFGEVRALEALDLSVGRGEIFGFLGPNGAGKTTMIRTILDEIRPTPVLLFNRRDLR